ncbi:MAG: sigma-54-dependent Fis family transcriptional regulator [Planctomycetes bacterium]|nr:sigma-54-dependent Fis family transcriptional regulator [Planctomycetota bacterium]
MSAAAETILVVDDAAETLEILNRNLSAEGYVVRTARGVGEAVAALEAAPADLVITDLRMPAVGGLDLVRHVRENLPDTEVMMITGYATVEGAVEAVKCGAEEYLAKPFTDEELSAAVRRALAKLRLRRAARGASPPLPGARHGLVGESESLRAVLAAAAKAATTPATVLLTGESGTGKELVARAIHYGGTRAAAPFVPVNCGGIPEGLLESELFGHVKGAFTGATESRAGFFQTAEGGTLFLDEIGETSVAMQVKLLRVLQDHEVCMVGLNRGRPVNVRVIAATNKDLPGLVRKGKFREDLFYRLNVISIRIPPLRERREDVAPLVRAFAEKFARELGRPAPVISERALRSLVDYDWPGNVREVENLVQRLMVMTEGGTVDVADLPAPMRFSAPRETAAANRTLADVEAEHIAAVLASVEGNKTRAAEILGIDRKTLRERLRVVAPPEAGAGT